MSNAEKLAIALEEMVNMWGLGYEPGESTLIDKAYEALDDWRSQQAGEVAEFESWLIARQRAKGIGIKLTDAEFMARNEDGSYRAIGFDLAHEAFEAGRQRGAESARVTSAQYQSLVDAATVVAQCASFRADRAEKALQQMAKDAEAKGTKA